MKYKKKLKWLQGMQARWDNMDQNYKNANKRPGSVKCC